MIDELRKEIIKIVQSEIKKYVGSKIETAYFGTITNTDAVSAGGTALVDIGFDTVSAKNLTGTSLLSGAKVILYAHGDHFGNSYVGRTF